jgi:hypothetical protein
LHCKAAHTRLERQPDAVVAPAEKNTAACFNQKGFRFSIQMLKTQATGAIIQRIKQAPWGEASKGSYDKLA